MTYQKIAILMMVLLQVSCGAEKTAAGWVLKRTVRTAIVSGNPVRATDPVAHVTVGILLENGVSNENVEGELALCTGTLIAPQIVLTAAHCLAGASSGWVLFGPHLKRAVGQNEKQRAIADILVHPEFNPNSPADWNDVALVRFSGDMPDGFTVVDLLAAGADLIAGQEVSLAGYGASQMPEGVPEGASILRAVSVALTDPHFSRSEFLFANGPDGGGACHGDSGGPAFVQQGGALVQIGITSRSATVAGGSSCAEGSIYTSVAAHTEFIQSGVLQLLNQTGRD